MIALSIVTLALGYIVGRYSINRKLKDATQQNVSLRLKFAYCARRRDLYYNAVEATNEWVKSCKWDTTISDVERSELYSKMQFALYSAINEAP